MEDAVLRARAPLTDESFDFTQKQWDSIFGFEDEDALSFEDDSLFSEEVTIALAQFFKPSRASGA